jgi:ubiquitin-like protein Nedd8
VSAQHKRRSEATGTDQASTQLHVHNANAKVKMPTTLHSSASASLCILNRLFIVSNSIVNNLSHFGQPSHIQSVFQVMLVKVKSLTGQVTELENLPDDALLSDLKARIQQNLGIPTNIQRIIFSGRELAQDDLKLTECGITDGAFVHLVVRMQQAVPAVVPADDANSQHATPDGAVLVAMDFNFNDRFHDDISNLRFLSRTLSFFIMFAFMQVAVYTMVMIAFLPLFLVPALAWIGVRRLKYEYLLPVRSFVFIFEILTFLVQYTLQQVVMLGIWLYVMIKRKMDGLEFSISVFINFVMAGCVLWLCLRFVRQLRRMTQDERFSALAYL